MKLLNKLTIKNLKLNKKRTIVTMVGIVLSITLITTISSIFFSLYHSMIEAEKEIDGNYHYGFINVPKSDIKYFKENRNFEDVYIINDIGYAPLENCENSKKPYAHFISLDESALNNMGIKLVEGSLPKNDNEVLIPKHLIMSGHIEFKIGDNIDFTIGRRFYEGEELTNFDSYNENEELLETNTKKYKVVGIIERPIYSLENYNSPGFTFITLLNNNNYNNLVNIYTRYNSEALKDEINITSNILGIDSKFLEYIYSDGTEYSDEEKEKFESMYDDLKYMPDKNSFLIKLESNFFKDKETKLIGYVAVVLIFIIVIASIFCIKNSFDISVTEKTKQYGMLSTIGATSKQIKKNVYYEALILSLISIPLGIIISLIISFLIVIICNKLAFEFLGFELKYSFSFISLIISIILGFLTIFISSCKSAHSASKIIPLEAISNSEKIKIKKSELKTPKVIKKLFSIGGDISYKNLQRSKKRYRPTIITMTISIAIFIALSTFLQITLSNISSEFRQEEYNVSIYYNVYKENQIEPAINTLLESKYVNNYSITSQAYLMQDNREVKFSNEYIKYFPDYQDEKKYTNELGEEVKYNPTSGISIYKIGDYAYKKYLKSLNLSYDEMKNKGIIMNYGDTWVIENGKQIEKNISFYNYQIGDIFSWKTSEQDKEEYQNAPDNVDIEIGYITDKLPFGLNNKFIKDICIIVSDEYFNQLFSYINNYQTFRVYVDSSNPIKFHEEIENTLVNYEYSIENFEKEIRDKKNLYFLLALFIYGFIIIISLIGLTSIINIITSNMELRSREFATLKSIGMTNKEFNKMIRLESLFYGAKSLLYGLPLGIIISYIIFYKFAMANLSSSLYTLPIKAIIISIIAVFILISVIMKYSVNKINKQNMIDTIRNENI